MAISIRNPEVEILARRLAEANGCSMTEAILLSLSDRLEKSGSGREDRLNRLKRIAARCTGLPDQDTRSPDEILAYGETGLP